MSRISGNNQLLAGISENGENGCSVSISCPNDCKVIKKIAAININLLFKVQSLLLNCTNLSKKRQIATPPLIENVISFA